MKDREIKIDILNLTEKGIKKAFGFLETEVMETVWKSKDKMCVRDVFDSLKEKREIAYTTVMTTMDRLYKKGVLFRKKISRGYVYWPAVTREKLEKLIIKETLKGLFSDLKKPLVSYFTGPEDEEDMEFIESVSEIIENLKKES